jgi:hypothetical protein
MSSNPVGFDCRLEGLFSFSKSVSGDAVFFYNNLGKAPNTSCSGCAACRIRQAF